MDDLLTCITESLYAAEVQFVRSFFDNADSIRGGSLLVSGTDAREVVRVSVKGGKVYRLSCLEAYRGIDSLDQFWQGIGSPGSAVIEDLDFLAEEDDARWIASLCSKLDSLSLANGLNHRVVGSSENIAKVDRRLRRSGRFDQVLTISEPPSKEAREAAFAAFNATKPAQLARLSPGYTIRDFLHLLRVERSSCFRKGDCPKLRLPRSSHLEQQELLPRRWEDFAGYEEQKNAIRNLCEWPLLYPETLGALSMDAPSGILLHGPSGCGKSLLASVLAGEIPGTNFLSAKATKLYSRYLGETEAAIRALFARARAMIPCILFIDEIDALCPQRTPDGGSDIERRVLGTLLSELDGVTSSGRAVLLACTNRRDLIDPALLRPGRIDHHVYMPLPSASDREAVLRLHTAKLDLSTELIQTAVGRTEGLSCAALQSIARHTAQIIIRESSHSQPTPSLARARHCGQTQHPFERALNYALDRTRKVGLEQRLHRSVPDSAY